MVDVPNFGIKNFDTEAEGIAFLEELGFELLNKRSDYDVWETKEQPKKRALIYLNNDGSCVVTTSQGGDQSPAA